MGTLTIAVMSDEITIFLLNINTSLYLSNTCFLI